MTEFLTGAELDRIEREGGGGEVIDPRTAVLDEPKATPATPTPKVDALIARTRLTAEPPPPAPAGAPLAKQLTRRLSQRGREERERDERWDRYERERKAGLDESEDEE